MNQNFIKYTIAFDYEIVPVFIGFRIIGDTIRDILICRKRLYRFTIHRF